MVEISGKPKPMFHLDRAVTGILRDLEACHLPKGQERRSHQVLILSRGMT